jgi:methionyl-tRNA formyltransferase
MNVVFMGSPEFATPVLQALAEEHEISGVVTQPDRPSGRGRELTPPAVKRLALELDLPLFQPERVGAPASLQTIKQWQPELIAVAAYGQILPPAILNLPRLGCLNVHASLLPRWRGAAPIQAAILHGDDESGVTIMLMDQGLDTGPILAQAAIPIQPDETGGELFNKLAPLGSELLLKTIPAYSQGEIEPMPQTESKATYAPMLKKSDGLLDFSQPAAVLARQVRAYNPWPSSYFIWRDQRLIVHKAMAIAAVNPANPGTTSLLEGYPAVSCKSGWLVLQEVQPAGANRMPGDAFLRGAQDFVGKDG